MSAGKPSRKASFTPEESAEVSRLVHVLNEARARGDADTFTRTADEIANYLMAIFGAFEGEA